MSALPTSPQNQSVQPPVGLDEELLELIRLPSKDQIESYFDTISVPSAIHSTKTTVHWLRIVHDATLNQPNLKKVVGKLFALIVQFACTRSEIAEAGKYFEENNQSTEAFSLLHEKARSLFTTASNTGEPGEILLYFLVEGLLRYPQILCKMPHKTNPNVHAHGADGVHASVCPETGHLRLHWGEAKLYSSLDKALDDCFASLEEMIYDLPNAKKSHHRDLELLRDFVDLDDPNLEKAILTYLTADNKLSNHYKLCGTALVGFNLADYSTFCDSHVKNDAKAIATRTDGWSRQIMTRLKNKNLLDVNIDVFYVPFESVDKLREAFLQKLG